MARVTQRDICAKALQDPRNAALLKGVEGAPLPPMDFTKPNKAERKSEKQLQAQCENWLRLNWYERLNAGLVAASASKPELWPHIRGWFGHWFESQRNAFMPDLFICNRSMTRCIMLELKVRNVYQPGQKELIDAGLWKQATSLDEAIEIVRKWEREGSPSCSTESITVSGTAALADAIAAVPPDAAKG